MHNDHTASASLAARGRTWVAEERDRLARVIAELGASELDQRTEEEDLGEVASASQHPADVASETLEREIEIGLLHEFRDALAELDAAADRLEHDRYGCCERCATSIPVARLQAVPATRWCLACAETVERDARWRTAPRSDSMPGLASDEFWPTDDVPDVERQRPLPSEEAALSVVGTLVPGRSAPPARTIVVDDCEPAREPAVG
jgi:RNA polymerase-binding transcription factor DksA